MIKLKKNKIKGGKPKKNIKLKKSKNKIIKNKIEI
tara:strand:+ start:383 stop:487 length:105 start_codon:yes stop_codon:yes gene_type:complete